MSTQASFGEHKAQLASALDSLGADNASKPGHERVEGVVGGARRFGPEGVDQFVVRARPHAVQDEVRKKQAGLRARQPLLDPFLLSMVDY
jgi:hypothetical protein